MIGIITVLLTAMGVYISKKGSDLDKQKQEYQQHVDETNRVERQNRLAELNRQLKEADKHVQDFDAKIQQTYRQIQDYDFKQNDPQENKPARVADHQSYLYARETLDIFSKSKKQYEAQVDELQKEIDNLTIH